MITKITQIEKLSRFKAFSSSHSSLELGPANLLYAPNGHGKSTISDIVRSFLTNDPAIIVKRTSKVYPGTPVVHLTHSTPLVHSHFNTAQTWTNALTDENCLVFDKAFIQQNVHTTTVEHDHKKKMYTLLVGSGAITAKAEVSRKRQILTDLQRVKNDIAGQFNRLGVRGVTIAEFAAMECENEATLIKERDDTKKKLEAAGNPEIVKAKVELSKLTHPYSIEEELKNACTDTVTGGSKEAIELIKQHSQDHIHGTPQQRRQFLAASVDAMGSKSATHCPTCGQSLAGTPEELVAAMFAIFSKEYLELRKQVSVERESLEKLNDTAITGAIKSSTEINLTRHGEWSAYIKDLPVLDDLSGLDEAALNLTESKKKLIEKLAEKHDEVGLIIGSELTAYTAAVTTFTTMINQYNEGAEEINKQIREYKAKIDTTQKAGLEKQLIGIENRLLRAGLNAQSLVVDYIANEPAVTNAANDHVAALKDFEEAQKEVIAKHGKVINDVLTRSGARFQISGIEQGKKSVSTDPYIEYSITLVGGTDDAETAAGEAIGYILSDGEKNLLAFAFFWSLLVHSDLSKTTAIFDDPLSSVDESWRFNLIKLLQEATENGLHQLFILTHFMDFARVTAQQFHSIKQLTITNGGPANGHSLESCDVESLARELQYKRIDLLQEYIADPRTSKPEIIQGEIRILLESALKSKYYLKLKPYIMSRGWLRDFVEDTALKPLLISNGSYTDLSDLTTVSGYAHHENPPAYQFDETQATTYAQLALDTLEKL
jgi:wobble nucleotide-excising tRNase